MPGNFFDQFDEAPARPRGGTIYRDPYKDAEEDRENERLRLAQEAAERARQAQVAQRQGQAADLYGKGLRIGASGQPEPIPGWQPPAADTAPKMTAEVRSKAIGQWNSALEIDRILADLRDKYAQGPGSTQGVMGLTDYLPLQRNETFNKGASQARGIIKNALGLTGGENNTALEGQQNLGGYLPSAGDRDETIVDTFTRLEGLRDNARRQAIQTLGGVPDANGAITPVPGRNAMEQPYLQRDALGIAGAGATEEQVPIPAGMQREYDAYLAQNIRNLDPEDYVRFRTDLDRRYGFSEDPAKSEEYRAWATEAAGRGRSGGTVKTTIPGTTRKMSAVDQARNNLVNNGIGAGAAGFLNMGSLGGVEALAGDRYNALKDAHGTGMLLGEVGGSILGTGLIGKAGASTVGRLAPRLLGGRGAAQFGRNLATDAAYGGIYGGVTQGDPFAGAATAGVASIAGQGAGSVVGRTLGGAGSRATRYLQNEGIPLTVGQAVESNGFLGRTVRGLEDRLSGYAGLGDVVRARRTEGLEAYNRAMFDEALSPIGVRSKRIAEEGVDDASEAVSNAYGTALKGKGVPIDEQAQAGLEQVRQTLDQIPDIGPKAAYALDKALRNAKDGVMDGRGFQSALQRLKKAASDLPKQDAILGYDAADALHTAQMVLEDAALRSGSPEIVAALRKANAANRGVSVVEDAVRRARNGSRSGEPGLVVPSQLVDASLANAKKYGGRGTKRPMYTLGQAGQKVLPSNIPDSGTAGRLALLTVPSALGGIAGAGYGASQEGAQGAAVGGAGGTLAGAALTGALALGGSKQAQRLLVKTLTARNAKMKAAGRTLRKKKGLLGSGSIPLLMGLDD